MTDSPHGMTPQEILDLPMEPNESGAVSVRGYLVALLGLMWEEGEGFSSKRPFGNSGWECDLYEPLVAAGLVRAHPNGDGWGVVHDDDESTGRQLIREAISALLTPASPSDLLAQANGTEAWADALITQAADLRRTAAALRVLAGGAA